MRDIGRVLNRGRGAVAARIHRLRTGRATAKKETTDKLTARSRNEHNKKGNSEEMAAFERKVRQRFAAIGQPDDACPASLLDLPPGSCKWPVDFEDNLFCGAPAEDGKPYCAQHCAAAYTGKPPEDF
jgi:hypothetical protein